MPVGSVATVEGNLLNYIDRACEIIDVSDAR